MFHSEEEAKNCTRGDVVLVRDLETGLTYNQAFRPELMQYDADYQNEQAVSAAFRRHLQRVLEIIRKHFQDSSLIEVGCGKGYFLEQLQAVGFKITGLDPAYEGSNPAIIREYFRPEIGLRADGIILRHVLEHVQDPVGFLSAVREANGGGGKIYIEVPCFDWICDHRAWFDIFYEHVNYFRLSDFHRMFGIVHEAGHTFNGQYLYVVADLATIGVPEYNETDSGKLPEGFLDTVSVYAAELGTGEKKSAIWGGASKGVLFALFMQRAGAKVNMVIDINPAKQGKYLAATGLQVRSPDEATRRLPSGANVFVMNGNYLDEVRELTADQFNYLLV
jgi:SAM-dependent methyltransferase